MKGLEKKMRRKKIQNKENANRESAARIFLRCLLFAAFCLLPVCASGFQTSDLADETWNPAEALQAFLAENYPWEKIEVSNVHVTGDVPARLPDLITVERGPLGKGVFSFSYDNSRKTTVRADVRAFDFVVKSRRPFNKGYVLQDEDLYVSEMDINKIPKGAVKDPGAVIGKNLKRSVMADMVIAEEMVEKEQLVRKGRKVVLLIGAEGFSIAAAGETKEKGYVGTQIKAMNLSSKKEVRGVLIDENTVRVEL
ncbi:MAG: flagella basal body P-ring formation protein FlgA [Nitrospiraceae bacterium]|nr:MAG: flagella basal body P-ring formation protein FlgA [Nitrospiraceae bacterium]